MLTEGLSSTLVFGNYSYRVAINQSNLIAVIGEILEMTTDGIIKTIVQMVMVSAFNDIQ